MRQPPNESKPTPHIAVGLFTPPRRLGRFMRLMCLLASVNPDRLAACPRDDHQATLRVGLAMLAAFAFVTTALTSAMAVAFELHGGAVLRAVPVAALLASSFILIDHAIIQSDWYQSGLKAARRRGFNPDGAPGPGWLRRAFIALTRLTLSFTLAFCVAGFMQLAFFAADIQRQRLENHRASNAEVFAAAAARTDAAIARQTEELRLAERAEAAALASHEELARGLALVTREQMAAREARVAQLQQERNAALAEAARRRADAINEEHGRREAPHHTGVARRGPAWQAAIAHAEAAEARAAALAEEIRRLQSGGGEARADLMAAAAAARADLDRAVARRAALLAARDAAVAGREAVLLAAAEADPRFVPMRDGLIERLNALGQLLQDPAAMWMALGIKALIIMVEMGGLLVKMLLVSPGLYSLRTAIEAEAAMAEAIGQAEAELAAHAHAAAEAQEARAEMREERARRANRRRTAALARDHYERELE